MAGGALRSGTALEPPDMLRFTGARWANGWALGLKANALDEANRHARRQERKTAMIELMYCE